MKVSIITAVYNSRDTIEDCIKSVLKQSYKDIEYVIVDGCSNDGSVEMINRYRDRIQQFISEPDRGIYDALNKGIEHANGDVIGFLHSDDFYSHDGVIDRVVKEMKSMGAESCYGDLVYVSGVNPGRIIRYWKSKPYVKGLFERGWMPPHPTFFVKRSVYKRYGNFNNDLKVAADYELMLRFLERYGVSACYIPEVLINMRLGGKSNKSISNIMAKTSEDLKAWKINNMTGGYGAVFLKNITKLPQFFKRPI